MKLNWTDIVSSNYYLFGAGQTCKSFLDIAEIKENITVLGIVDSEPQKIDSMVRGYRVYELSKELIKQGTKFIITSTVYFGEIRKILEENGLVYNTDFFSYQNITTICLMKLKNELWQQSIEIDITSRCTLNCEKCAVYIPHVKEPQDIDPNSIFKWTDQYFNVVDKVRTLFLSGGEAFLHESLSEIITYIGGKYGYKIENFVILSNGSVVPDDDVVQSLKENNVMVTISEYDNSVVANNLRERFINKLVSNNVLYEIRSVDQWIDLGNPKINNQLSLGELRKLFEKCETPCRVLYDSKVYFCSVNCGAVRAELIQPMGNEYFNLSGITENVTMSAIKEQFMEFSFGKISQRYLEFCKYCDGFFNINTNFVEVGKQVGE